MAPRHRLSSVLARRAAVQPRSERWDTARWHPLLQAAVIATLACVVYIPAMRAGFVFDDFGLVTNNPLIQADDGLARIWSTTTQPDYFPLTSTSLWLEWRLWQGLDNPASGFHVTNIVLHALNAALLWVALRRLSVPGAFFAALVFAVHPVNVSSVAWIAERKNTLSMLWLLSALLCYLRFEDTDRRRWYVLSLLSFVLALLSKTSVVMLPPLLLLLAWFRRGRLGRADLRRSAPFFALAILLGLVTVWYQHQSIAGIDARPEGLASRLAATGWCAWFYLFTDLLPVRLATIYPRWHVDPASLGAWLPLFGMVVAALVAWRYRRTGGRAVLLAGGVFLLMLLPALGLVTMTFHEYSLVADHFQYSAMIAPIALVAAALAVLLRRAATRGLGTVVAAGIVLASLGWLTWDRADTYQNSRRFWIRAAAENDRAWIAHGNLGVDAMQHGRTDEAIRWYRKALEVKQDYADAHYNLAVALRRQGAAEEALSHLRAAIESRPGMAEAHNDLGLALEDQGLPDEAERSYRTALSIQPEHYGARTNLGNLLFDQGRIDEAVAVYRRAAHLNPASPVARYHLGAALYSTGQFDAALGEFNEALRLRPNWPPAIAALERVRAALRQTEGARPSDP